MKKISSKSLLILGLVVSCHMMACAGIQSGGPDGEGVAKQSNDVGGTNMAAPAQSSGTLSPGVDPDPDPTIYYKAKFEKGDLVVEDEGVFLKGLIEKRQSDAPNMDGLVLKVIDRRTQKFLIAPLTVKSQAASEAAFSVLLKTQAFDFEELSSGKPISFFLSPHSQAAEAPASGEMTDCQNPVCMDADWFKVSLKSDAEIQEKDAPFVPQGNPAPGAPPSSPGNRPAGKLKMPGSQ